MLLDISDAETIRLIHYYVARLGVPTDRLRVTTDRATFATWLGRRVSATIGGVYAFLSGSGDHAILINLARIDRAQPRALEIVVAEELIHLRDRVDGDRRRHAKHGYDRIAHRVATLTGATLDEVRACLLPVQHRPLRYVYTCPDCGLRVPRRVRGTWSCGRCAPTFDVRFRLVLVGEVVPDPGRAEGRAITSGPFGGFAPGLSRGGMDSLEPDEEVAFGQTGIDADGHGARTGPVPR